MTQIVARRGATWCGCGAASVTPISRIDKPFLFKGCDWCYLYKKEPNTRKWEVRKGNNRNKSHPFRVLQGFRCVPMPKSRGDTTISSRTPSRTPSVTNYCKGDKPCR